MFPARPPFTAFPPQYNHLSVEVYDLTNTRVVDADGSIRRAIVESYDSFYPGGVFGAARVFCSRRISSPWFVKEGYRIVIRNNLDLVYEGKIVAIALVQEDERQGMMLVAVGYWAELMERRNWDKPWCEMRVDEARWVTQTGTTGNGDDQMDIELANNRLRFIPKHGVPFMSGDYAAKRITAPTGETFKRFVGTYDLQETALASPDKIWHFDSPATYTDLTNAYDDSTSTSVTVTITTGDYIYIGLGVDAFRFTNFLRVDMGGTVNAVASVMTAEYYNGTAYAALAITDGTAVAGKTLAQDGDITFTKPADWDNNVAVNGSRLYWMRLLVSVNLTASIVINEIKTGQTQVWELVVRNVGTSADVVSITSSGTGATDHTFATPTRSVEVRLYARAIQFGLSNGTVYGQWSALKLYTETGTIDAREIIKDLRAKVAEISSSEGLIDTALTLPALEPFVTDGFKPLTEIALMATRYGTTTYQALAVYLRESEAASLGDGKPVLCFEAQPTSGYDYAVRWDEGNLVQPIDVQVSDVQAVRNYIVVSYTDPLDNRDLWLTPADDSTLKDQTSIDTYGQRELIINIGQASATTAANYGRRVLADNKNPVPRVNTPLKIIGYIRAASGLVVPASTIRAGKRLKLENILDDRVGDVGAGVTFLMTSAQFTRATQICEIGLSVMDSLAAWVAQQQDFFGN